MSSTCNFIKVYIPRFAMHNWTLVGIWENSVQLSLLSAVVYFENPIASVHGIEKSPIMTPSNAQLTNQIPFILPKLAFYWLKCIFPALGKLFSKLKLCLCHLSCLVLSLKISNMAAISSPRRISAESGILQSTVVIASTKPNIQFLCKETS